MELTFKLIKRARSMGGDRYTTTVGSDKWDVYFPQSISRKGGEPREEIVIHIDVD